MQYANLIFKDKKLFNDLAIDDIKDINNIKFSPEKEKIDRKDFRRRSTSKSLRRLSKKKTNNFPPKRKSFSKTIVYKNGNLKQKPGRESIKEKKISEKNLLFNKKLSSRNSNFDLNEELDTKHEMKEEKVEIKKEEQLDNYELNNLEYEKALKLDKRSLISTYWSIIKREHLLLFTFIVRNDYNIPFVKYSRFIFNICSDMAVNVFFYSDATMHKTYVDYAKYNFIQQIPQIIISTVVAQILEVFLCFLSMTDKHFYEIKELDYEHRYDVFKIIKRIKTKLTFYFIVTFLLFAFYWYAIACFCAVYPNTQGAFIVDSVSSFILGLLYPFILYLFPAAFRIIALRCSSSCFYSLSDIIPFF